MINTVNPCENCSTVRDVNEAGYKVFTFRNPYLGNTCVPFLHWACDYNCAKDIEIPGKIFDHKIHTANIMCQLVDLGKGGFNSEDTGEFLHCQHKYSISLS